MNPEVFSIGSASRAARVRAGGGGGGGKEVELSTTSTRDELAAALSLLRERGVSKPEEFAHLGADVILDTVAWFDTREGVTAGVLVLELRAGGKKPQRALSAGERSREYADQLAAWLNRYFPDLRQTTGNPHPAAVVEVIHLHHELGRGRLLPREHAARIRTAVKAFDRKWGIV